MAQRQKRPPGEANPINAPKKETEKRPAACGALRPGLAKGDCFCEAGQRYRVCRVNPDGSYISEREGRDADDLA